MWSLGYDPPHAAQVDQKWSIYKNPHRMATSLHFSKNSKAWNLRVHFGHLEWEFRQNIPQISQKKKLVITFQTSNSF